MIGQKNTSSGLEVFNTGRAIWILNKNSDREYFRTEKQKPEDGSFTHRMRSHRQKGLDDEQIQLRTILLSV
jgi:hypothetical protein